MPEPTPVVVVGGCGRLGAAVLPAIAQRWPARRLLSIDLTPLPREAEGVTGIDGDAGALSPEHLDILRSLGPIQLVWLAARIGVEPCDEDEIEAMISGNVSSLAAFLARSGGSVERFVFAGSVEGYGDPPGREAAYREDQPLEPRTAYGISKMLAERCASIWCRGRGLPFTSLRFASIYGPGEPLPKAITDFLRAAAAGSEITLLGDGSSLRDYVYLTDAAAAVVRALESPVEGPINIAHPERLSLLDLAELAVETCGRGSIRFVDPRTERRDRVMDVTRMRECLGFDCEVDARQGVGMVARAEGLH